MEIPLKLLIVEDSEDDTQLLVRKLRKAGYKPHYERVDSPETMSRALEQEDWDIVIADYAMPHFDGIRALQLLQQKDYDLPFIIVSGAIGEEMAVAAMKAGAHDYIMKDNLTRLIPAIEREMKEAEIRLKRKQADEQIKSQLHEKEILLKEIHHRVKNNLQLILSLIKLQVYNSKDERVTTMFQEIQTRIRSMVMVHELLFHSDNLATIQFTTYLKKLVTELYREYCTDPSRMSFSINDDDIHLDVDTAIYCGLIVNELFTNALKHAFPKEKPGKGIIAVEVRHQNDLVEIIVKDNGIGLKGLKADQASETLGLKLVHLLVEDQLEGSVSIDSNEGTLFHIKFKLKSQT